MCIEACGPPDIKELPPGSHRATPILKHMRTHGVPITIPHIKNREDPEHAISYGDHKSATKECGFVQEYLAEQLQAGHVVIFPLAEIQHLSRIWLSLLAATSQKGHKPRLI